MNHGQLGHVSTGWTIITFALIAALLLPVSDDKSVLMLLLEAIRGHYAGASFGASLP